MKKTIFTIAAAALTFPAIAYAQPTSWDGIKNLIVKAAQWMYTIFFIVAVIYILLAAYKYLMAKDDAAQVKKAQISLKNAVIAIAIALVATGVAQIVESALKL